MLILLKFLEFRQMSRHFLIGNPLTIPTVIPHAEGNHEVISHNATDIQVVVQVTQCLVSKEFVSPRREIVFLMVFLMVYQVSSL